MKFSRAISCVDVKRAFVAAEFMRRRDERYVPLLSDKEFSDRLAKAKAHVKKMGNAELDRVIVKKYPPRRDAYDGVDWHVGMVKTSEVAVWRGAGGLPASWTSGSLDETAKKIAVAFRKDSKLLKARIKRAIPRILRTAAETVQKEKYLLPIILPAGTIPSSRRGVRKFKGDIDDGSMRCLALAISGTKIIKAYVGVRKKSARG